MHAAEEAEAAMMAALAGVTLRDLALDEGTAEDPVLGPRRGPVARQSAAPAATAVSATPAVEPVQPMLRPDAGQAGEEEKRAADRSAGRLQEGSEGRLQDRPADRGTNERDDKRQDERHEPIFGSAARTAGL
jgi:hypothetical protein